MCLLDSLSMPALQEVDVKQKESENLFRKELKRDTKVCREKERHKMHSLGRERESCCFLEKMRERTCLVWRSQKRMKMPMGGKK